MVTVSLSNIINGDFCGNASQGNAKNADLDAVAYKKQQLLSTPFKYQGTRKVRIHVLFKE